MSHQLVDGIGRGARASRPDTGPDLLEPGRAGVSVVERFRTVARARPDAPALQDAAGPLSYRQLDRDSGALARAVLARLASGEGEAGREAAPAGRPPVAVLAPQGRHAVLGTLAALRAGRAAVLLDPQLPDERLRQILAATGAPLLLSGPATRARADRLAASREGSHPVAVLGADTGGGADEAARAAVPAEAADGGEPPPAAPESAAHGEAAAARGAAAASIVFTSGSTGRPKGVVLSHDTVVNGAAISGRAFGITPADQVAVVLPIAFAAGQESLWTALLNGATAQLHDPRDQGLRGFGEWLRDRRITTLHTTPSLLRSITGALEGSYPDVRLLTTCGEAVHGRDAAAAREQLPRATFGSWLGASELGHLAFHFIGADEEIPDRVLPVGKVVPTKQVVISDERGQALPHGKTGAVEVRSAFLASGYWDDADATREKFRPLPDGLTAVRTGDIGSLHPDGTLQLSGRAGSSVKIRGYLVEPAEVEAALRGIAEIADAAVLATGQGSRAGLTAYAVPDGRRRTPSVAAIRRRLRETLPDWMLPAQIILLTALPRTERGKLDRAALPEPPPRAEPVPPADQWEAELAEIWSAVLEVPVGRECSFPLLGGDSLAAEEMLTVVAERLKVSLLPIDLAERPTLREFAALVAERSRTAAATGPARAMRPGAPVAQLRGGPGPAVLCFSGAGGSPALFTGLAAGLDGGRADAEGRPAGPPVYAFAVNGFENRGIPDWTVPATARRYLRLMRDLGPQTAAPAALLGHSLGGLFALEVAQLLRAAGRPDPLLVLLDTILPPAAAVAAGDRAPLVRVPGHREQTRRERWSTRFQLLGAGLLPYRDETRRDVFFQHGARLTRFHRPRPWDGRAVVFRSLENLDAPHWWDTVLTGPHEVVEIPSDHVGVLKPPYLADVIGRIDAELAR